MKNFFVIMALCAIGMFFPGIPAMFIILDRCGQDLGEDYTFVVGLSGGVALSAMLYTFFPFADVVFGLGTIATVFAVWQLLGGKNAAKK